MVIQNTSQTQLRSLAMRQRVPYIMFITFTVLVFLFLYFPVAIIMIYSFNDSEGSVLLMNGFTFNWYIDFFRNESILSSIGKSLLISIPSVAFSAVVGTWSAYIYNRIQWHGKKLFLPIILVPIVLPGMIVGISLLIFLTKGLNFKLSLFTVAIGHVSFILPIVFFLVLTRLSRLSPNLALAAMDMGANQFQIFRYVIFPLMRTSVLAASLMAFTLSFDEVIITFLLTGTDNTLPMKIMSMMRFGISPEIYVAGTLIIVSSILIITLFGKSILQNQN
jgi:spermidine/putrescine transport system permease protein